MLSPTVNMLASQVAQWKKKTTCNAPDTGEEVSIPELGRSSGEENGNPLQYSCPPLLTIRMYVEGREAVHFFLCYDQQSHLVIM